VSDLTIDVVDGRPAPYAAVPTLVFGLEMTEPTGVPVHAAVLRCQIMIEPQRRRYAAVEEDRLLELFGRPPQWSESLRPFLWTHATAVVQGFTGRADVELAVPCTYDFEVTAAKYLHALEDGEIPLSLLFSGTVFARRDGVVTVQPVPWHVEASYRLAVTVWRELMDLYFPNSGWIRLRRDSIDALTRYKAERALPTWDDAVELLLEEAEA
jgi:hypothetical protein